jgi:hypothetical protein
MPGESVLAYGNEAIDTLTYFAGNVTYPTLAANVSGTNTLTVPGTLPGDFISCAMQTPPAHLFLDNAYVSAANTVTITWSTDGTGVTGASTLSILLNIVRADRPYTSLPSALT